MWRPGLPFDLYLGCRFHVRDLIGHGELQRVHTTSGPLLRAVKRS
jgi:membrane protein YdbS with pleckstrin-like domain